MRGENRVVLHLCTVVDVFFSHRLSNQNPRQLTNKLALLRCTCQVYHGAHHPKFI